jgi:hypothetical protein
MLLPAVCAASKSPTQVVGLCGLSGRACTRQYSDCRKHRSGLSSLEHSCCRACVCSHIACLRDFLDFLCAALDSLELERMSSGLQSYSRQLVALEEAHVANSDFAASTMTSTVAQIQARRCLLGSVCSKQCA